MLESTVLHELRCALRRQGIWGARAERLLQEWTDHAHESAAQRIADGATAPVAEQAAWEALGQPHVLAASAARQLTRASWLGRHPWLTGLVFPLLAWFLVITGLLYGGSLLIATLRDSHPWIVGAGGVRACDLLAQWTPWLLSLTWLTRLARTLPGGWKHYWITATVLTLLATSAFIEIHIYPIHGPGPDLMVSAMFVGILGTIANIILYYTHTLGVDHVDVFNSAIPWVQTAISVAGLCTFHAWSRSALPELARSRPA